MIGAPRLVLLFGIANATLYSSLLPLWEGFDETFHYGYVQYISTRWSFPVLGRATISEEIWQALQAQPVSHYIQASTHAPVSFTEYFGFSREDRNAMRKRLESIPAGEKYRDHAEMQNYEVNQPPIPYLLLGVPDRLMAGRSIVTRVLVLRLLLSIGSVVLLWFGIRALAALLGLPEPYAAAAAFCVFSSQMLYATIAHISNDSLAVPLMVWYLWSAGRAIADPSPRRFAIMALMLALGLLTKAYFLFVMPVALGVVCRQLWRNRSAMAPAGVFLAVLLAVAGPWYSRNIVLYHDLAGTGEKTAGFGARELVETAVHLPWLESISYMATSSLWTGNNSFTTFSARTLYLALALIGSGAALYLYKLNRWRRAEVAVVAAIFLFGVGLLYITVAFFYGTRGAVIGAMPWYAQTLLAPVMLIVFLGIVRSPRLCRPLAIGCLVVWAYLISATYLLKLIPLYAGFTDPHARLSNLSAWYLNSGTDRSAILSSLCPAPAWWIYALTVGTIALACVIASILGRRLYVIEITV